MSSMQRLLESFDYVEVTDVVVSSLFFFLFIYLYPGVFQDVRDLNAISQVPEYHISFLALL